MRPLNRQEELKMRKFISLILTILFTSNAALIAQERFGQYRRIEAYEIRPGILMMPRYTAVHEVCEIGLERLQYSPTLIRVSSALSREEIFEALDELVPAVERGKPSKDTDNLITLGGLSQTTNIEYENVSIQIYGAPLPSKHKNEITVNEVVATVKWKHRICL
jgi:hypothetical protein